MHSGRVLAGTMVEARTDGTAIVEAFAALRHCEFKRCASLLLKPPNSEPYNKAGISPAAKILDPGPAWPAIKLVSFLKRILCLASLPLLTCQFLREGVSE